MAKPVYIIGCSAAASNVDTDCRNISEEDTLTVVGGEDVMGLCVVTAAGLSGNSTGSRLARLNTYVNTAARELSTRQKPKNRRLFKDGKCLNMILT